MRDETEVAGMKVVMGSSNTTIGQQQVTTAVAIQIKNWTHLKDHFNPGLTHSCNCTASKPS